MPDDETIYLLWAEKYRPKTLDEIVNQEETVARLKRFLEEKNVPHMLFAGPPGTGKTTTALAFAHDLYGENYYQYLLELNASVSKDTPILVRIKGKPLRLRFKDLDKMYFADTEKIAKAADGEYVKTDDLEVLTFDVKDYRVKWAKASWLIRHKASHILRIKVRGGGTLELTGNHSIMVIDEKGELKEEKASNIRPGDYIVSFVSKVKGENQRINLQGYVMKQNSRMRMETDFRISDDIAWLMGLYVAAGAVGYKKHHGIQTSRQLVITPRYPRGKDAGYRAVEVARANNIAFTTRPTKTNFNRTRKSAVNVSLLYTLLAKYVRENFYDGVKKSSFNRIPIIMYSVNRSTRIAFLKGLAEGGGSGGWKNVMRIASVSREFLIDIVWLARMTGIESTLLSNEARLILKGSVKYKKSDLLPARPFIKFLERNSDAVKINWRNILRQQLYEGKETVSKTKIRRILRQVDYYRLDDKEKKVYERLLWLSKSDLHVLKVTKVELMEYEDYVYDISVPNNNMFYAGEVPILLHNSDERGIDVIRTKIKEFARARVAGGVPFKLIMLDEADNMTSDAQQALRRLMENYTATSRFILIANYPSKIIEPIQSRTALFRFTPLKKEDLIARLAWISKQENVDYDEKALEVIFEISEGDMRKAINILQAASAIGKVTVDSVYKVVGLAHPKEIREMITNALRGDFEAARNRMRRLMISYGLSGMDIVKQIHREIFSNELEINDDLRVLIADYAGEIQFRLVEGADDEIQLNAFLAWLTLLGKRLGL